MSHIHIDITDLSFSYDKTTPIFDGLNLHIGEHESVGIIGPNGAGKSTLLKMLVGLILEYSGEIRICEIPITKKTLVNIRERVGYVFQDSDSQLFMPTVYEDVAFAPRNYGLSEAEVEKRVLEALKKTQIEHLKNKSIYKLSGGEKKLASIATILSMTPDIILMDEPSVALDPKNRRNLIHILNQFDHLKIIASHDLDFILDTCDRAILLSEGKIIADGPCYDILSNKDLLEAHDLELPLSMMPR